MVEIAKRGSCQIRIYNLGLMGGCEFDETPNDDQFRDQNHIAAIMNDCPYDFGYVPMSTPLHTAAYRHVKKLPLSLEDRAILKTAAAQELFNCCQFPVADEPPMAFDEDYPMAWESFTLKGRKKL